MFFGDTSWAKRTKENRKVENPEALYPNMQASLAHDPKSPHVRKKGPPSAQRFQAERSKSNRNPPMNFSSAGSKRSLQHPLQGRSPTSGKLSGFLAQRGLQLTKPYKVDISIGGPRETRSSDPSVRECLCQDPCSSSLLSQW